MKQSKLLPFLFAVAVACIVGAAVYFSLPYLQVLLGTGGQSEAPPPAPEPAPKVEPAKPKPPPPPPPKPKVEPKKEPAPPPPPKVDPNEEAKKKAKAELEKQVAELYPLPQIKPLEVIVDNWGSVPPRAFPKGVTINNPLEFKLYHQGQAVGGKTVPAGAHVVPVELSGETLVVTPDVASSMRAEVNVDSTNFKNLIHARYMDFVQKQNAKVMAARAAEIKRIGKAEAYETALSEFNDGSDPRFDPVKESLKKGEAGTFELDFATEYRWLGKEEVDGTEYDAALVAFETESAFGVARTEIKALIRDDAVEKWVNATTGEPL